MKKTYPDSFRTNFSKITTPDNNLLYTIKYLAGVALTPNLTKILCNKNGDILAYIDIKQLTDLQRKFNAQFKILWFGIQEWHPNLIGHFRTVLDQDYTDEFGIPHFTLHPGQWTHDSEKHLYTFTQYGPLGERQDWFRVHTDPMHDGKIETNFHIYDKNDTRTYEYNTHPLTPTGKIELLTKYVLYKDGVITKKEFNKYMRNEKKKLNHDIRREKYQNVKKQVKEFLTRTLTDDRINKK